jgi:hypothetical protein
METKVLLLWFTLQEDPPLQDFASRRSLVESSTDKNEMDFE